MINVFTLVDYDDWYRKFTNNLISTLIVFVIICFLPFITCNNSNPLDEAIDEYTNTTGKKIYPYGKDCLKREGDKRGLKTKDQYILLIKENEKWLN